jgi:predicted ArsR family transcriptional regulator
MNRPPEITDPRALRALAHPTRLALVGLLRAHGSLTATEAGRILGLSSGSCSFHLRQLARFGLVEEVDVPGRRKPWRATARATAWPSDSTSPELAEAAHLLSGVVVERYREIMHDWLNHRDQESPAWQEAAWFGDLLLHLTADELADLGNRIEELVAPYTERVFSPELRPAGSRAVSVLHVALPREPDPNEGRDRS